MVLTDQKSQSTPQNGNGLNPSHRKDIKKWTKEDLEDYILKQEIMITRYKLDAENLESERKYNEHKFRNEKILMAATYILLTIFLLTILITVK